MALESIMNDFLKAHYIAAFLNDLEEGFKSSTVLSEAI
jgi:hypothetical protein